MVGRKLSLSELEGYAEPCVIYATYIIRTTSSMDKLRGIETKIAVRRIKLNVR